MDNLVVALSRYIIILLMTIYTLYCFTVFRDNRDERKKTIFNVQTTIIFLIHFICYMLLFISTHNNGIIYLYVATLIFLLVVILLYSMAYKNLSRLILNNMCMLITVGFVMLTRLDYEKAAKQIAIVAVSATICLIIPFIIDKLRIFQYFGWIYGGLGILMLLSVTIFGTENYGSTRWIEINGVTFQPSEFVKITYVFCIAALLTKSTEFKHLVKVTALAALHVIIFALSKDLGDALIFFVVYLVMLYVATRKPVYVFLGAVSGSVASIVAYHFFSHVRVRVVAWIDPFSRIDNEGYQVAQSLFAIGTGGWFGMGLNKGLPNTIPVVENDFIFAAISEELGAFFAVCLMFVYLSCFIMFVNIAMKLRKTFYKYIALGLSLSYIFQVFLTIGGVTKFIPSTGMTLPLISSGGSSIFSTLISFSIIQGLYVLNKNEDDYIEKERLRKQRKENKRTSKKQSEQ